MSQELFRREVVEARRAGWLGAISLAQPLRLWVLTAAALAAALAIALYLTFGSYTRRSTVAGQLVPAMGLANVLAPATGVVSRLEVEEGARVAAGQMLAVVTVPRATLASGDTVAALEQRLRARQQSLQSAQIAQQQLFAAQGAGLATQLVTAQRELAQLDSEIATRQEQVRIAEETLAHLRQLHADQYVSQLELRQHEAAALEQVAQMQELERQALTSRRQIAQLQQSLRELPQQRQSAEAGFQRDLAALSQEQVETEARGALAVAAPVAGVVATPLVKAGQAVQAGQPLLSLLPGDGKLEAELLVPSRAVGFIAPGDRVLLRYQAYPWQKFGHQQGNVARISRSALNPGESGGNAGASQPLYRVTVRLARQTVIAYGKAELLKPGMLLDADILGETRRLIEWLFEPLYSIKGRIGG